MWSGDCFDGMRVDPFRIRVRPEWMLLHIYPMLKSGGKNTYCMHGMLNTFIVHVFNMKLQFTKQNKKQKCSKGVGG